MTNVEQGEEQSQRVFINYYKEDSSYAQRLYSDLSAASLSPWIDKEDLLPGQIRDTEIEKAIKASRYFVALMSTRSIKERGDAAKQINMALKVQEEFLTQTFFIPARLDELEIPFVFEHIEYVDLFPTIWEEGLKRILKAMNVDQKYIESIVKHQKTISPFELQDITRGNKRTPFKGEKQFFVGRQDYINQIIKDKLRNPGSKVSIVGPGGSGKSQLAFKAMQEYVNEGIFDIVISIYFDEGLLPFDKFLLQMAEIMGMKSDDFQLNTTIEQRKGIIRGLLSDKKHPLIYLDNFETVSLVLNQKTGSETRESIQNAKEITNFLNDIVPRENTSILVTSREKKNNLSDEYPIDLEGLNLEDSMSLFNNFVRPIFKDLKGETRDQIEEILRKTGGHPLSIEIIAKNLRGLHELESISNNLGSKKDPTRPGERFETLQACFDYTIKRLDNKLQELIPKLTLFKSPFPISAAVEIFGITENEILDLHDRSLLKVVNSDELYGNIQDPTYWLYNFYLPVRGYIEDKMEKNGPSLHSLETEYGEAFSKYYYDLLLDTYYSIGKENHLPALARFNIMHQGKEDDFESAVQLTTNKNQSAIILSTLGLLVSKLGMSSGAIDYHYKSLDIHEDQKNWEGMAIDFNNIGTVLSEMGNYPQALEYHKKALDIDKDLNYRHGIGRDYSNIGTVLKDVGNNPEALEYLNKALEIHEDLNERDGMAKDYNNIGLVFKAMDDYQQALEYYKKSIAIHEELNDRIGMSDDYLNLGVVLRRMGRFDEALKFHTYSLEIHENLNDRVGTGKDYWAVGLVHSDMSNHQQALEYYKKALEIQTRLNDRVGMAQVYSNIGIEFTSMGNYQQALEYHNKGLEISTELDNTVQMVRDYGSIGLALNGMNKHEEAAESVEKGLDILLELEQETGYHHPLIEWIKQIKDIVHK